jgi:4-hydroxybenzoyl-CoA reductase subunit beta
MLRLPPFTYLVPRTAREAVEMLGRHGQDVMPVAGGTDLFPNMKRRQFEPRVLVGLRGLQELRGIRGSGLEGMTIGAGCTLTEVSDHPAVSQAYPALARAAGWVSTPQLRTMGTIGGNLCVDTRCTYYNQTYAWRRSIGFCMKKDGDICLVAPKSPRCWAVSSSDTAPVVIALGGTLRLIGPNGERTIPAQALYNDDGIKYLAKDPREILCAINLPPADGWRATYWKLRRRGSFDFPILGVAAALKQAPDGTVQDARIVLGAAYPTPVVVEQARMLVGQRPTADLIEAVAQSASGPAKPLDNTDLSMWYRKRMSRVYIARALRELAGLPPVPAA